MMVIRRLMEMGMNLEEVETVVALVGSST